MRIVCPNCATSYEVQAPLLGEQGRSVRCVRCRAVWLATPSAEAVTAGSDAWPPPAPDPWPMADRPQETGTGEQFPSLGDDAPNEDTAPHGSDSSPEEPPRSPGG